MASKSPPRRRRQMLWAPTTLGDDESTRIDDHPPWDVVAQAPQLNPSRLTIEVPSLVQRAEPLPIAPLPRRPGQATPAPPMAMAAPPMYVPMPAPVPAPLSPGQFYSYAETYAQQLDTTAPVAPLPFAELATNSFPRQISRWSRIAMPAGGAVAIALFVIAFFATRDDRPELPSISTVSRAEAPVVLAAAAAPAPAEIPADSHWKPRTIVPTIAAEAQREEAAELRPEVVEEPVEEIEMAQAPLPRKHDHAAKTKTKAKAKTNAKHRVAAKAPRDDDPVLAELAKPVRAAPAKATGPGKAVVSSDVPSLVYIDGRSTSLRTPTTINLQPGTHRITLVAVSTRKAKTVDVEIKAGASVPVHRDFGSASSAAASSTPSGKKRIKVDSSTALGNLRPGKAW